MKLQVHNNLLGIFAGDKFTPKSNFSLQIMGTTGGKNHRDLPGVIYKVLFPSHPGNNEITIWVPYETTDSAQNSLENICELSTECTWH